MNNTTINKTNGIAVNAAATKLLKDFWVKNQADLDQELDTFIKDDHNRKVARGAILYDLDILS